jgi:hypothetical protein
MGFPQRVAAVGPNYADGDPYYPVWHPTALESGTPVMVSPNFGVAGSQVRYAGQGGRFGRTAKLYSLTWDPGVNPGFDPRIAPWNNLPRGTDFRAHIPSVKRHANYGASTTRYNIPSQAAFVPPGVASLTETS